MGFFQDLKQDLSQTVNGLEPEDAVAELNLEEAEAAASQDLFGTSRRMIWQNWMPCLNRRWQRMVMCQ